MAGTVNRVRMAHKVQVEEQGNKVLMVVSAHEDLRDPMDPLEKLAVQDLKETKVDKESKDHVDLQESLDQAAAQAVREPKEKTAYGVLPEQKDNKAHQVLYLCSVH